MKKSKKNYIYLTILIIGTIFFTLMLASLYKNEIVKTCYAYDNLNQISANEFDEYMLEHPDTIIYISDKTNTNNNKFEKKLISKLEKNNLLENVVYIEKEEITDSLIKKLKENYSYKYDEEKLPVLIVISDGKMFQTATIDQDSTANTIIDYEALK